MGVPISQKFTDRQNILNVLHKRFLENNHPNADETDAMISFSQLALEAKVTDDNLRIQLDYLSTESEVGCHEIRHTSYYLITIKGRRAAGDNKYKKLGEDEFWNNLKNWISIAAFILSIVVFIWNINNSNQISKLNDRIQKIESK